MKIAVFRIVICLATETWNEKTWNLLLPLSVWFGFIFFFPR